MQVLQVASANQVSESRHVAAVAADASAPGPQAVCMKQAEHRNCSSPPPRSGGSIVLAWTIFGRQWDGLHIAMSSASAANPDAEMRLYVPAADARSVPSGLPTHATVHAYVRDRTCPSTRCWVTELACMQRAALADLLGRRVVLLEADQFVSASFETAFSGQVMCVTVRGVGALPCFSLSQRQLTRQRPVQMLVPHGTMPGQQQGHTQCTASL